MGMSIEKLKECVERRRNEGRRRFLICCRDATALDTCRKCPAAAVAAAAREGSLIIKSLI
jgi:hypothetical protein